MNVTAREESGVAQFNGVIGAGLAIAIAAGLGVAAENDKPITISGFSAPESVLYDPQQDVYLVTNMNGGAFDKDHNGFISRVSPSGRVLDLKWIEGERKGVTLHSPKGSAFKGDLFMVADVDAVRLFDRKSGKSRGEWVIPNASLLNDITVDTQGVVYVTDTGIRASGSGFEPTGRDAIYKIDHSGKVTPFATGKDLGLPNGIVSTPDGVVMAPLGLSHLIKVDPSGHVTAFAELPHGLFDGLLSLKDGTFLVTSNEGKLIYHVDRSGHGKEIVTGFRAADIGLDTRRNRLLMPLTAEGEIRIDSLDRLLKN